jgi:anti-anti-sigma factor
VLYSDGAIERRGEPLDVGMERLADAASAGASLNPEALCTRLLDALAGPERRRDDVALLAARVRAVEMVPLRLWFAARPDQLAVVREAMRSWLASAGVEPGDGEILVLAAGELCANAVEHAYPAGADAAVEIALAREPGGALSLVVRDKGRWRVPGDPGNRGRGLGIVRALMHAVDIDEGPDGTTVTVHFTPGGAPAPPPAAPGPAVVSVDDAGVVALTGEVDGANAREVEARLLELSPAVIDLSGLAFLGSAGIQVLLTVAEKSVRLALVVPRAAPFRRALEVAELGRVVFITASRAAALEHLRAP